MDTSDRPNRPWWRKKRWLVAALIAAGLAWRLWPPAPAAQVSFAGYGTNAAGERIASFAVSNTGDVTLRRWDFYDLEVRGAGRPAEEHLGPDAFLRPGETETVAIPAPAASAPWRLILSFSAYGALQQWGYRASGWPTDVITDPLTDRLIGGPEFRSFSEWLEPDPSRQAQHATAAGQPAD